VRLAGFGVAHHTVGLISSVLFLVPGFPLVTSLLDMLQHETVVALARLTYATMLLLTAALGLSVVIAVAGFSVEASQPLALAESLLLVLRALASFAGACGFAMLYNSSSRTVLRVGMLAIVGNTIRLALHDAGLALPPATFVGAFVVGLMATAVKIILTNDSLFVCDTLRRDEKPRSDSPGSACAEPGRSASWSAA
jgi:uncharacterized membrane protein YjjB (DUF3815 family)